MTTEQYQLAERTQCALTGKSDRKRTGNAIVVIDSVVLSSVYPEHDVRICIGRLTWRAHASAPLALEESTKQVETVSIEVRT